MGNILFKIDYIPVFIINIAIIRGCPKLSVALDALFQVHDVNLGLSMTNHSSKGVWIIYEQEGYCSNSQAI